MIQSTDYISVSSCRIEATQDDGKLTGQALESRVHDVVRHVKNDRPGSLLVGPVPVRRSRSSSELQYRGISSCQVTHTSNSRLTPSWNPSPPPQTAIPNRNTVATPIIPRFLLAKGNLSSKSPTKMAPIMAPSPSRTATSARVRPLNLATFRAPC